MAITNHDLHVEHAEVGLEHHWKMNLRPVLNHEAEVVGIGASLTDITSETVAHRQAEQMRSLAETISNPGDTQQAADGIIVSGEFTGLAPRVEDLEAAREGAGAVPVLVGSGLDDGNARRLMAAADGAIVGTSLKTGDVVDVERVRRLVSRARSGGPSPGT